jgi:hypothetical protein
MYFEIENNCFYIEDNTYDISKVYFGQQEWITDLNIQDIEFYNEPDININEAMYLICYIKDYEKILIEIEEYIKPYKEITHIKSKLKNTIHRIRFRQNRIWTILLLIINKNILIE